MQLSCIPEAYQMEPGRQRLGFFVSANDRARGQRAGVEPKKHDRSNALDNGTKKEHCENTQGIQELIMTAFARDLAAFVSMSLFVASFAVLAMAF